MTVAVDAPSPAAPGTYVLLLHCPTSASVNVGRLGRLDARPGWYAYVGSAFGPGGLAGRLRHHLRPAPRARWHVDYLRQITRVDQVCFSPDATPREHEWAQALGRTPGALAPLRSFGASDCACASHLFHFEQAPDLATFGLVAGHPVQAWHAAADSYEAWQRDESSPFSGWDFSHLAGRMSIDEPPWDYLERAAALMQRASSVLDLGTGGGERLLSLRPFWPPRVAVTEEWPPNVRLARERLEPLGVTVKRAPADVIHPLPFADDEFDLVLNRHSGFGADEVARVLAPGGVFLTQQVHGQSGQDLQAEFGAKPQWPWATSEYFVPCLQAAGLNVVLCRQWEGRHIFRDVGAIAYYLKAVPWMVPDFSIDRHLLSLVRLHERLGAEGNLRFSTKRYLIEASKPHGGAASSPADASGR